MVTVMNYKPGFFVFFIMMCMLHSLAYGESNIKLTTEKGVVENKSLPVISNKELDECEEKIRNMNQTAHALMTQKKELETAQMNVQKNEKERDDLRTKLDLHNPEEVLKYNQVNQKLKKISSEYRQSVEQYNHDVKVYQNDIQLLKSQCDDKQFVPE